MKNVSRKSEKSETILTRLTIPNGQQYDYPLIFNDQIRLPFDISLLLPYYSVFFFIVQLCTRGLNHVKKFLDNEERKRGGGPAGVAGDTGTLTQAGHRGLRSRESFQLTLRHPISKAGARDSGYTTSDGSTGYNEKRSVKYTS